MNPIANPGSFAPSSSHPSGGKCRSGWCERFCKAPRTTFGRCDSGGSYSPTVAKRICSDRFENERGHDASEMG